MWSRGITRNHSNRQDESTPVTTVSNISSPPVGPRRPSGQLGTLFGNVWGKNNASVGGSVGLSDRQFPCWEIQGGTGAGTGESNKEHGGYGGDSRMRWELWYCRWKAPQSERLYPTFS